MAGVETPLQSRQQRIAKLHALSLSKPPPLHGSSQRHPTGPPEHENIKHSLKSKRPGQPFASEANLWRGELR
jgi:hypothetical protein